MEIFPSQHLAWRQCGERDHKAQSKGDGTEGGVRTSCDDGAEQAVWSHIVKEFVSRAVRGFLFGKMTDHRN